jgi:ComF family protein
MRIGALASLAVEVALSLLAPPRCAGCDERVPMLHAFCASCASTIVRASPKARVVAAFVYGGAVARAIARCKYEDRPDLARVLADLLWRAVEDDAAVRTCDLVVPVPLHAARLAERGYNQAALVARPMARRMRVPMLARALARTRDTPRQAALHRAERLANVDGAFAARTPNALAGGRVLLVDDVCTTGATLDACERAILDAGAAAVTQAVVARAEL